MNTFWYYNVCTVIILNIIVTNKDLTLKITSSPLFESCLCFVKNEEILNSVDKDRTLNIILWIIAKLYEDKQMMYKLNNENVFNLFYKYLETKNSCIKEPILQYIVRLIQNYEKETIKIVMINQKLLFSLLNVIEFDKANKNLTLSLCIIIRLIQIGKDECNDIFSSFINGSNITDIVDALMIRSDDKSVLSACNTLRQEISFFVDQMFD